MMKKRVLALMMAGMMVFGGTMPVFAEADTETEAQSEDPIVWSYEDIDPDVYDGEWASAMCSGLEVMKISGRPVSVWRMTCAVSRPLMPFI